MKCQVTLLSSGQCEIKRICVIAFLFYCCGVEFGLVNKFHLLLIWVPNGVPKKRHTHSSLGVGRPTRLTPVQQV